MERHMLSSYSRSQPSNAIAVKSFGDGAGGGWLFRKKNFNIRDFSYNFEEIIARYDFNLYHCSLPKQHEVYEWSFILFPDFTKW